MSKQSKEFIPNLKAYHIILLGCFLTSLLILNSNYVNQQRAINKLNIEKSKLFNKIIATRNLEGDGDTGVTPAAEPNPAKETEEEEQHESDITKEDIDKVCEKGSESLKEYYKTGDLEKIELKEGNIKSEDSDKEYIQALINIIKKQGGGLGGGRRRNLQDEEEEKKSEEGGDANINDELMKYGKHMIPSLFFIVVAILCIPGWVVCCSCCCCNCCCCCCCKNSCCKIPCFIITYALYALVIGVCIYGLARSNAIFVGFSDTECSILRFFDEVVDGESKIEPPKWPGINKIKKIMNNMGTELADIKAHSSERLDGYYNAINDPDNGSKENFLKILKEKSELIYEGTSTSPSNSYTYNSKYIMNINSNSYVLDLVKDFGKYNKEDNTCTPYSITCEWIAEFRGVSNIADEQLDNARDGFNDALGDDFEKINEGLGGGSDTMDTFDGAFTDIKNEIAGIFLDYYEKIDDYGKLGFKLIFAILAIIDIAIAAFMLLLCFCSGKLCNKCCCCRCLFKLVIHLLWNIYALLMIITFLVGSLFTLIGTIGKDVTSVVSFLISEDNIGEGKETVIIPDNIKNYLTTCINGKGDIMNDLGLGSEIAEPLDSIKAAQSAIIMARGQFLEIRNSNDNTYKKTKRRLEERMAFKSNELKFYGLDNTDDLKFIDILNSINDEPNVKNKGESWDINSQSTSECKDDVSPNTINEGDNCFHPKKCLPEYREWISSPSGGETISQSLKDKAKIITSMNTIVSKEDFMTTLDQLGGKYIDFLDSYLNALNFFNETIDRITGPLNEYTDTDGKLFSFINCKFIGTNLKILLKYLHEALGVNFYTIGVCLLLVGSSMALSICFTILLIIIINSSVDSNKKTP